MVIKIDVGLEFPANNIGKIRITRTHRYMPPHTVYQLTLWSHTASLGYSVLENQIIACLLSTIQQGYRLTKAMRNSHINSPACTELTECKVCDELHDLAKSYFFLKTCVFLLMQRPVDGPSNMADGRVHLAIHIHEKMHAFVHKGIIPNLIGGYLLECPHSQKANRQSKFLCCRKRVTMLVAINHILDVLKCVVT